MATPAMTAQRCQNKLSNAGDNSLTDRLVHAVAE